jgi:hypothetical protein
MEKAMTIDLRKDAPNQVSTVNPDQLSKEINTLQEIKQEIDNQEKEIKKLKEREKYYSTMIIPDLMNEITVKFGLNEDNKAEQYASLARGQGYDPDRKVTVHAGTLRTTLRDYHERGGSIPAELFNTFEGNQTEIKTK